MLLNGFATFMLYEIARVCRSLRSLDEKSTGLCEKRPVGFYRRRRRREAFGRRTARAASRDIRPIGRTVACRAGSAVNAASLAVDFVDQRLRAHSSRKLDGLSGSRAEYPTQRPSARPLSRAKPRGDILSSKSISPTGGTSNLGTHRRRLPHKQL